MLLASRRTSFILGAALGLLLAFAGEPLWKLGVMRLNQEEFGDLTFDCDNSMRGHLLARQRLVGNPSESNVIALKSAEIRLID